MTDERVEPAPVAVPDLTSLGLPPAETGLLRLLLAVGAIGTRDAATRLGLSVSQVSNAAGALRDRGFAVAGLSRSHGILLAPLEEALAALLDARRRAADDELERLERTRADLLAVARWRPAHPRPHTLVPRDLREWERVEELQRVTASLDLVVDRHHVNSHVPATLLRLPRLWQRPVVRLLVTGTSDPRPLVVTARSTDLDASRAGIAVRRLGQRCAAFSVYDGRRVEVPLWRLEASGWSDEPGEVWAAGRLFDLLWAEAEPWPGADEVPPGQQSPPQSWSPAGTGTGTVGSAR